MGPNQTRRGFTTKAVKAAFAATFLPHASQALEILNTEDVNPESAPNFSDLPVANLTSAGLGLGAGVMLGAGHCKPHANAQHKQTVEHEGRNTDLCLSFLDCASTNIHQEITIAKSMPAPQSHVALIGDGSGKPIVARNYLVKHKLKEEVDNTPVFEVESGLETVAGVSVAVPGTAVAERGDSSGAVFSYNKNSKQWELLGIIIVVDSLDKMIQSRIYCVDLTKKSIRNCIDYYRKHISSNPSMIDTDFTRPTWQQTACASGIAALAGVIHASRPLTRRLQRIQYDGPIYSDEDPY